MCMPSFGWELCGKETQAPTDFSSLTEPKKKKEKEFDIDLMPFFL